MSTLIAGYWLPVRDGDARARALYLRHYSANPRARRSQAKENEARFIGPGEHMALLTQDCSALFARRKERWRLDHQVGVNCTIFRNEGPAQSSDLIREADELAWNRWADERHFTFVDASEVESPNPGYCFKMAGWRFCGRSKSGLHILEITR